MNETQVAQTISVIFSLIYLAMGWVVLRACIKLRDSMIGMMGYRLMFVITRLVQVLVITLIISLFRQIVSVLMAPDSEYRILLQLSPILVNALLIGSILWVLLTVRSWKDLDIPDPKQDHLSETGTGAG